MGKPSDRGDTVLATKKWVKEQYPTLTDETVGHMAGFAVNMLWLVVPDLYPEEFVWILDNKLNAPANPHDWYRFVRRAYKTMAEPTKHLDEHRRQYTLPPMAPEWASEARREVARYYKRKKAKPL